MDNAVTPVGRAARAAFLGAILAFADAVAGCGGTDAAPAADDGGTPGGVPGSVTELGRCDVPGSFPAPTTCRTFRVTCAAGYSAELALRTTPRAPSASAAGAVILGSGGTGREFLAGSRPARDDPALQTVRRLARAGYRVIERRWPEGWFGPAFPGEGLRGPACLYATLVHWLEADEATQGALCAFGNSGGSAEIGYALTQYDAGAVLDAAFLSGGPPTARLDIGCLGEQVAPGWRDRCAALWNASQTQCPASRVPEPRCTLFDRDWATGPPVLDEAFAGADAASACTGRNAAFAERFRQESVVAPDAELAYPSTPVHFIVGRRDCTEAPILGHFYHEAITSETTMQYAANTPHDITSTAEGARTLVESIKRRCQP